MRYGGLRRATITVRDDGRLDVVRERDGTGETFRGCATLDEAFEVVRAHGPPISLPALRPEPPSLRTLLFTMRMSEVEQTHMRELARRLGASGIADMLRRLVQATRDAAIPRGAPAPRGAGPRDAPSPAPGATARE